MVGSKPGPVVPASAVVTFAGIEKVLVVKDGKAVENGELIDLTREKKLNISSFGEDAVGELYILAFDGRIGTGRSFLVDPDRGVVIAVRDFSVRTG
mgnify:CR=1 FL=1